MLGAVWFWCSCRELSVWPGLHPRAGRPSLGKVGRSRKLTREPRTFTELSPYFRPPRLRRQAAPLSYTRLGAPCLMLLPGMATPCSLSETSEPLWLSKKLTPISIHEWRCRGNAVGSVHLFFHAMNGVTMLRQRIVTLIDDQYRRPVGLLGRWIGGKMLRQHRPENLWTLARLDVQPGDRVLEVGFGPGLAIQELAALVTHGHIAGVDFSPTMVAVARRRNAAAIKRGRVDLRCSDARSLPFTDDTFDKAFSIHSIYFWPEPLVALGELWRVLRPGGMIAITVLPKEKWGGDDPERVVGTPSCIPYSGTELIRMLASVGFSAARIEADPDPRYPSNFTVLASKER